MYRGLKGASLPAAFFEPNEYGVCGGVEYGFTSTSCSLQEAMAYATATHAGAEAGGEVACPTLLEVPPPPRLEPSPALPPACLD